MIATLTSPDLTIEPVQQLYVIHPALGVLSDGLVLVLLVYLWKFHRGREAKMPHWRDKVER